ncbi:unnamed protein product [Lathyrus oleraceus]|uniref:Uncharacterized protein n=1 Tax=Pisum sativum TaxID=3888 RepID=A0A9D4YCH9_PEA|nr:uncharacterized protein LOC127118901 [Pisum sativum]KAI5435994.1 hypothetical protein KIW84_022428 [Pisum sativum]
MRGIGGPLLCIGDLLSDVGEENEDGGTTSSSYHPSSNPSSLSDLNNNNQPLPDLTKLFQENYYHLNEALNATDHSWTSLTLKLCTSLDTANKLVQCTNSNVASLLEKVEELEKIVKRGDSAIAATKAFYVAPENNSNSFK